MWAASVTEACKTEEKTGDWAMGTRNMVESSKIYPDECQSSAKLPILDDPAFAVFGGRWVGRARPNASADSSGRTRGRSGRGAMIRYFPLLVGSRSDRRSLYILMETAEVDRQLEYEKVESRHT